MKLVRYSFEGVARFGALEGDEIRPMTGELSGLELKRGARPVG